MLHALASCATALLVFGLGACSLVTLKQDTGIYYSSTVLVGRIDCPASWRGPLVVAALRASGGQAAIAHQTLLHECGSYELIVPQGEYALMAFGDANDNFIVDHGEPAGSYAAAAPVLASGTGVVAGLDFVIGDAAPLPVARGTAFNASDAPRHSTQVGALAQLDAPAFSADSGKRGYWAPVDTFRRGSGNIHFLEPYDPKRIPVLFVHGAVGSPQDWRYVIEHLDRRRYQAWFFQYPSGAAIDSMAYLLYWKLLNLQLRHRFDTLYLAAHSMGGLVSRQFLLNFGPQFPQVKLFVTLSTPWSGEASAELGVKHSPAVVPSWVDMQPEGAFIQSLFQRPLPAQLPYYLFFGHKGGYSLLQPNNDGTVTLASQLRDEAQAEARRVYGFDEDHVSILSSPQVLRQFHAVLDATGGGARNGPPAGQLRLNFTPAPNAGSPVALPALLLYPVAEAAGATTPRQAPLSILLSTADNGQRVGPIPPGLYDASVFANAWRTAPAWQRVHITGGSDAALDFRLQPQGSLNGYVGADQAPVDSPAGSYRPPHPTVKISRITLEGAGQQRTLVPRHTGEADLLPAYLEGRDDAHQAQFSFVGLPAGDYELTLLAEGYKPHRSRHRVVPGQPGEMRPIVLTRSP